MPPITRLPAPFEVYMQLHDREFLVYLMKRHRKSSRVVATAAGWKSHTYLLRLLSGEESTLAIEPAVRIAEFFGVPTNQLFTVRSSGNTVQSEQTRRTA